MYASFYAHTLTIEVIIAGGVIYVRQADNIYKGSISEVTRDIDPQKGNLIVYYRAVKCNCP